MIFNELSFFLLFLAPSLLAFHGVQRLFGERLGQALRPWILAVFGAAFFLYYGAKHFGGALGAAAILIFVFELLLSRLYSRASRLCLLGIVQAILILAIFKYSHFFSNALGDAVSALGFERTPTLPKLILPLGVSFFTFEFIHVAADVYKGKLERPRLPEYAAFIFFFPSMVAGPIKRYQDFVPQLTTARFEPALFQQGITRIVAGLAKKHVLADTFSLWADQLNSTALYGATPTQIVGWVLAYGLKIYFDFSGYSDIAIGCGYLFGIHIPENFDWPYLSKNIREFWRRWHISLSSWIFDYVYAPLGGSRHGRYRTALNLLIAFGVSGLWHGAAYNFVFWGLWHGLCVIVHRIWSSWARRPQGRPWDVVATGLTIAAVSFGWALFCMDVGRVAYALQRVFHLV
jgi:alginate O-acetyltransferase complex protein AlgI